jgi:hypothetical protein
MALALRAPTRPGATVPLVVMGAPARTGRTVVLGPIPRALPFLPRGGAAPREAEPPPPVRVLAPTLDRALRTPSRPGPTVPLPHGAALGARTVVLGALPRIEPLTDATPRAGSNSGAVQVGILPGEHTMLAMLPADLTKGPRTDITQFRVVEMDAGEY